MNVSCWWNRVALGCVCLISLAAPAAAQDVAVTDLRVEYQQNPLGIDVLVPRLSWRLASHHRGTVQAAYEIRVANDAASLSRKALWDSGHQPSSASLFRPYGGPPVQSATRYYWQVRVWDSAGHASAWSKPAFWEMGLLAPTDWVAHWITPDLDDDTTRSGPAPLLRREFVLSSSVASARLYVTSLGVNQIELNGRPVDDRLFRPGWTSYNKRLQYDTYDVTKMLQHGSNAIGVTLGDGWYRGWLGYTGRRNIYGTRLGLLAQLVVRYTDGSTQVVTSDDKWKASTGPILMSDFYNGETYDARLEKAGWSRAGYDDHDWNGVHELTDVKTTLVAPVGPPARRMMEIKPTRVFRTPAGETVFDLGQNMVGWVRFRVRGPAGTVIRLRHAEVLDRAGNMYTHNLRRAQATVTYTLKGGGMETFEPHFTLQGFRYVSVEGWPGTPTSDALTGIVIYSDMTPTGTFETSNPLINRLQQNIVWSQRGNFVDIPTDCPQRDERLGWTGDAEVFSPTAAFNMDVSGFFAKWVVDIGLDQMPDGAVPFVIPDIFAGHPDDDGSSAGWGDAAVIVPWNMFQAYGDTGILARQYASMRAWVEYARVQAGDSYLWTHGSIFGDWLNFVPTDKVLIATAYWAHSTDLLARTAAVLGKADDAERYQTLLGHIRTAFQQAYLKPDGSLTSNSQTAYVLALEFNMLPDSVKATSARLLDDDVRRVGHLTTGFLGAAELTPVLTDYGYIGDSYRLLLNQGFPSWLYEVTHGATTVWERWDGQRPDGTFQDSTMNSFNHYAYGAVGDWLYRVVAGLSGDSTAPGYRHLVIRPEPSDSLQYAKATLVTPYGEAVSGWSRQGDQMRVTVEVPANTHATVYLPGAMLSEVRESGHALASAAGVTQVTQQAGAVRAELGSGSYLFTYPAAR